jgi:hypothetical protein
VQFASVLALDVTVIIPPLSRNGKPPALAQAHGLLGNEKTRLAAAVANTHLLAMVLERARFSAIVG